MTEMTNEQKRNLIDLQLVTRYQQGEESAFTDIHQRFEKKIESQARKSHLKYPSVEVDDFYSYFVMKLLKAAETYDLSRSNVPFDAYVQVKLSTATYDFIKRKIYSKVLDENGRQTYSEREKAQQRSVSMDAEVYAPNSTAGTASDTVKVQHADRSSSYEYAQSIEETDLYKYIAEKSSKDAMVAVLMYKGYEYGEIAEQVGHDGNYAARRNWTMRAVKRIKGYCQEFYEMMGTPYELDGFLV